MNNLPINDFGNLITICPFCNARIINQFQAVDLYVYTNFHKDPFSISLRRIFTKKPENELYIKSLLINSLKKKPLLARIVLTRPLGNVIHELRSTGFLSELDLKGIEISNIF